MFQRAIIFPEQLRSSRFIMGPTIDLGRLAETLVFYDEVYVLAEPYILINLITSIGGDVFVELLKQGRLRVRAVTASHGTRFTHLEKGTIFNLNSWGHGVSLLDDQFLRSVKNIDSSYFSDDTARPVEVAKAIDAMHTLSFDVVEPTQRAITLLQEQAVTDENFLSRILSAVLNRESVEAHLDTFEIEREPTYDSDYPAFRMVHKKRAPQINRINELGVEVVSGGRTTETAVAEAQALLFCMAAVPGLKAELAANPSLASAMTHAIEEEIVQRSPERQIASFQQYIFDDATAIRDIFDPKKGWSEVRAAYRDLIAVLERRDRFSTWLKGREPEANLVREYLELVYTGTPFERKSGRIFRFFAFTAASTALGTLAAGPAGTAIGAAASFGFGAFDSFLLDRLMQRWRPHQFSEGPFQEFGGPLRKLVEEGQATL